MACRQRGYTNGAPPETEGSPVFPHLPARPSPGPDRPVIDISATFISGMDDR
jgi:hypothetical protein